ncbi:MAG: carboxypeptidase-like regulatory domain-containing protein [Planctomycetota bacterium]|jgi:hypothetical protein
MIGRFKLKAIAVLTFVCIAIVGLAVIKAIAVLKFVCIAIVGLAVILLVGWFFLAMVFQKRMTVIGRVTDSAGRPIKAVQVRVVPLPIHSEDGIKPPPGKEKIVFTDKHGRFRFKILVVSGDIKQELWPKEYDITIKAEGYRLEKAGIRCISDGLMDLMDLEDIVLEKQKPP